MDGVTADGHSVRDRGAEALSRREANPLLWQEDKKVFCNFSPANN